MTYISVELSDRQVEVLDLLAESGLYGQLSRDEVLDRIVAGALVAVCGPALVGKMPARASDRCLLCPWSTPLGLDALARHVEEAHAEDRPLPCPYCVPGDTGSAAWLPTLTAWRVHVLTDHRTKLPTPAMPAPMSGDDDIPF